jgi:hypothetical protein
MQKSRWLFSVVLLLACAGRAFAQDGSSGGSSAPAQDSKASQAAGAAPKDAAAKQEKSQSARTIEQLQEVLERNAREFKALRDEYTKEMEQQRKRAQLQQRQIEILQQTADVLSEQLKKQGAAAPSGEAIEKLQTKTDELESRALQAALRDVELANKTDDLTEQFDAQSRYEPKLPAFLKGMFLPSGTAVSPLTIVSTLAARYDLFTRQRGAGLFEFQEFTPFFIAQLNKRILLSGEFSFSPSGAAIGQAQVDIFLTDWLTMDIGYFLAPIGWWNERMDPEWINKLPDQPVVLRQVIPDGLVLSGVQFRGARYVFGSPLKMEYSVFMTNGLGVPGMGQAADWADVGGVTGTTSGLNNAMAYGGRLGFWLPAWGINFGVSEFVNAPYSRADGAVMSLWQPYFNYHQGNWDFRFEYGQNYERTNPFIGNSIGRTGFYTQLAYRNYQSINKQLQRLEYVFRFSDARFRGINQAAEAANASSFSTPVAVPVDRNQYTMGINYYLSHVTVFKFAYEINQELRHNLKDNIFFMQFATNF